MKISLLLLIALPISCLSYAIENEVKLEAPSVDSSLQKRSGGGSFDFVSQIKKGLLSGAGRASASLAAGSSGSSSNFNKQKEEVHGNSEDFDPWSLKKSVLNTLFQAVKAITGGVTAIKGQIIKGSGYALSAGGSLIASSGDKITDVGKGIVNSAQLSPVGTSHGSSGPSPVGKFASLSAASSGSSSGSSSTSSHGSTGHGEIQPSYEIPTGHANYGPPSKSPSHYTSTSSHYLPPGTYTSGLHFTGPASYESSPHVSYLPVEASVYHKTHTLHNDFDDIHHNYHFLHDNHRISTNRYDDFKDFDLDPYAYHTKYSDQLKYFNPHSGPTPFLHDRDSSSATMALKELMQFLPRHETKKLTATYAAAPKQHKLVDQYEIPSEPIPKYQSFKVGPLSSVTRTSIITTAFGKPLHAFQKHIPQPLAYNTLHQNRPMHNIPLTHQSQPYDAYHSMTMRQTKRTGIPNPNAIPKIVKTPYNVPQFKYVEQMPWKVSLNPGQLLAPSPPSLPSFPSPSAQRSLDVEAVFASPSSLPPVDIEALVASLEAKKRSPPPTEQNLELTIPTAVTKGRTDRQFAVPESDNGQEGLNVEVQKSIGFRITDPDSFNRELMYL